MEERRKKMIAVPIIFFVVGIALVFYVVYGFAKKRTEKMVEEWWGPTIVIVLLLCMSIVGVSLRTAKFSALRIMRQRLNEPVISEAQLYGYEIVGKHMEEYDSPDDTSYFIDIKDILANKKILKRVETSQLLFEKIKIGNSFDWSLISKLKVLESETPTPKKL